MPKKDKELTKILSTTPIKKILHMPEDKDNAPHWLYWLFLLTLLVVVLMGLWIWLTNSGRIDPNLSYLPNLW